MRKIGLSLTENISIIKDILDVGQPCS